MLTQTTSNPYAIEFQRDLRQEVDYEFRGGAKLLIQDRSPEVILAGPAETGKTVAACMKLHLCASKYPGAQFVIARKIQADVYGTVLQTYERIIKGSPVVIYGGRKPQHYIYPNGSVIWIAGLDKPGKALSSERDIIYINQAEELNLDSWETLTTRTTGRGAVMPYTQTIGDANPGPSKHWIQERSKLGHLKLIPSYHVDNPALYTQDGEITEQGERSMSILKALTGVRRKRLYKGLWVSAEGAIYTEYIQDKHLIPRKELPPTDRFIIGVDFGYTNPFSCSLWHISNDGAMTLYRQIYETGLLVEDAAPKIKAMIGDCEVEAYITDHDAEDRATLEKHLKIRTIGAYKAVSPGIQNIKQRLKDNRLFFMRDALVSVDRELAEARRPLWTVDEIDGYRWSDRKEETPVKEEDHGLDEARYVAAYVDKIDKRTSKINPSASISNYMRDRKREDRR